MPGLLQGTDFDRQILIETKARQAGRDAYFRKRDKDEEKGRHADTAPGRRWLAHWAVAMNLAIRQKRRDMEAQGKKTPSTYTGVYALVSPAQAAAITLTQMLNALLANPEGMTQQLLCRKVGRAILAQAQLSRWRKEKKVDLLRAMFKKRRKNAMRAIDVNRYAKILDPEAIYDDALCIAVGAAFVWDAHGACSSSDESSPFTHAFPRRTKGYGKKKRARFYICDKVRNAIARDHATLAELKPIYPPMVVPPYRHADSAHGGYITIPLSIMTRSSPAQRQLVRDGIKELGEVIDGIEALGNTPLRVNGWMLGVTDRLMREGGGVAGLPRATALERPPKPQDPTEDEDRAWRAECVNVHRSNIVNETQFYSAFQCRQVARDFAAEPRFYMLHQLCFRGRAYARPNYFNHYGGDLERSLFLFADHREGDGLMREVAIQAATMFGHDKWAYEDRIEWVKSNMRDIIRSAKDPFMCDFWMNAENPLQFLAACKAIESREYATCLPIQRDATASGFQHFAAMTRDEVAAPFVNLVENDRPCALYAEVARRVSARIADMEQTGPAIMAIECLRQHGKDICKQPVMTTPYGVSQYGARQQIAAKFEKFGLDGEHAKGARMLLANTTLEVVREMFPRVTAAMDWIRQCARKIAEANRPVMWRTPIGWRVVQPYYKKSAIRVDTPFGRMRAHRSEPNSPVNVEKQVSGAAPNFVHGVDAAVLMRTAIACRNSGVAFLGVHDSFWSHAATADQVGRIARQTFATTHDTPLLTDLWIQWQEQYPDIAFEQPPENGSYDPANVINAVYAMC